MMVTLFPFNYSNYKNHRISHSKRLRVRVDLSTEARTRRDESTHMAGSRNASAGQIRVPIAEPVVCGRSRLVALLIGQQRVAHPTYAYGRRPSIRTNTYALRIRYFHTNSRSLFGRTISSPAVEWTRSDRSDEIGSRRRWPVVGHRHAEGRNHFRLGTRTERSGRRRHRHSGLQFEWSECPLSLESRAAPKSQRRQTH